MPCAMVLTLWELKVTLARQHKRFGRGNATAAPLARPQRWQHQQQHRRHGCRSHADQHCLLHRRPAARKLLAPHGLRSCLHALM